VISGNPAVIGVDMGATKILSGLVNGKHEVLARDKRKTGAGDGPKVVLERVADSIRECLKAAVNNNLAVEAVGIGLPGPLDTEKGIVLEAPNLEGWTNVPVRDTLREALGLEVYIENDANMGALGEAVLGAGRGRDIAMGVFVGSGIGGGIVINGKLFRGHKGIAGEVGHMIIRDGKRGSLEDNAGRLSIAAKIKKRILSGQESVMTEAALADKRITSGMIRQALDSGDPVVTPIMEKAMTYLSRGCASLVNIFDPSVIILGGGVVEAMPEWVVKRVSKQTRELVIGRGEAKDLEIVAAELGDDSALLGSVIWAEQKSGGA
jgi:glucokinase